MGIFDSLNEAGYSYNGVANSADDKAIDRYAGRDKMASDIASLGNMFQRVNLGANDARYKPFTGTSTQDTMSVSPSSLLKGDRNARASLFMQQAKDTARKNAGESIRDTSNQRGLEDAFKIGARISQGSIPIGASADLGLFQPNMRY